MAYHRYMTKPQVLLLFGGESTEHDVSVMSAHNVYDAIDRETFDVVLGYIDQQGQWFHLSEFDQYRSTDSRPPLEPQLGNGSFVAGRSTLKPDVLLPILHGKNGEDGSVQGLAQLLHVPVVGCDMTASAAGMDKVIAKRIAAQNDIQVVPYLVHRRGDEVPHYETIQRVLGGTLFVKPSRAGSSVGVSKVRNKQELSQALEAALLVDDTILIERALTVRELEVAVLGIPPHHEVSRVGEVIPGEDFYSYDDKYSQSSSSSVKIPADITPEQMNTLRSQAARLFTELGCQGLSRVDFFLAGDGAIYFNEINTLPGFTNISMYPKLWQDTGLSYAALVTRLVRDALNTK